MQRRNSFPTIRSDEASNQVAGGESGLRMNGPLSWLHGLAALLDASTCRYRGEGVSLDVGLRTLVRLWVAQRTENRAVYWIGNGGSAALVSHLSQDLLNTCGVRSLTFNDPALITCMANDYGYRDVFQRPLRTLARERDVLVAISSSGMSDNVVGAAEAALEMGVEVMTFSAFSERNRLHALPATLAFHTPTEQYGHAELTHGALLHAAIDCLRRAPVA